MRFFLLFLFIGIPTSEILTFILLGDLIGIWMTATMVLVTAVLGSFLLRKQGISLLYRAQQHLKHGQFPIDELFDGLCIIIAGILLITPGFITDFTGFLCFLNPVRHVFKTMIKTMLVARSDLHVFTNEATSQKREAETFVIDGEYEDVSPCETSKPKKQHIS